MDTEIHTVRVRTDGTYTLAQILEAGIFSLRAQRQFEVAEPEGEVCEDCHVRSLPAKPLHSFACWQRQRAA